MPRIDAPTVAEHHARQRRALLDAARALLAETGQAPSMAEVGRRAGLARSSVYQYFDSPHGLLHAVVADVFPDWASRVQHQVDQAGSPGERVWAYVEANIALFASSEQAVAEALARVVDPSVLRGPMQDFHAQLQVPLREALEDLGEPDVARMAETIDALIVHTRRRPDTTHVRGNGEVPDDQALALLRRLIGGYLRVTSD
ncbi:MAG TPA: TetR/AcrR family transcriptional regulator [Nocardioides sp.]|uniref:TetR/AcrR family transcriptional regulator n=1 Tax=Nocardioides sp. TaxID=35761 RepID=UPI002E35B490|nr:TetR/AcrR family transcriptional regulator [Nocardioides sp.]HEX5087827.1 TetR/AcrR family transcriptional regulator [Nocardioides sp.]